MWCFLICCIKWFFKTYSVFLFNFFSRRFIYLSSPSFKLVLTIFHNKLLKEKLWSRMEWSHKTKKPMKQNSISAAFKKPTLSPVILRKKHRTRFAPCVSSVFPGSGSPPMRMVELPHASCLPSCWVWKSAHLHIIRRVRLEDSKVLKSQMVMPLSVPLVQNLQQSWLSTSEIETWVMLFWCSVSRAVFRSSITACLSILRWMLCLGMSSLATKVKQLWLF